MTGFVIGLAVVSVIVAVLGSLAAMAERSSMQRHRTMWTRAGHAVDDPYCLHYMGDVRGTNLWVECRPCREGTLKG